MRRWRKIELVVLLDEDKTVTVPAEQLGSLALHRPLDDDGKILTRGWALTHAATGLGVPLAPLRSERKAREVAKRILADTYLWLVFSSITKESVYAAAKRVGGGDTVQLLLDRARRG